MPIMPIARGGAYFLEYWDKDQGTWLIWDWHRTRAQAIRSLRNRELDGELVCRIRGADEMFWTAILLLHLAIIKALRRLSEWTTSAQLGQTGFAVGSWRRSVWSRQVSPRHGARYTCHSWVWARVSYIGGLLFDRFIVRKTLLPKL